MVRKYQRKTQRGAYGDDKLREALKSLEDGTPLIRASINYGIPPRTLRRHRDKRVQKPGTVRLGRFENVLPDALELELKKHIIEMERMMYGLTIIDIRKLAFDLAVKVDIKHPFNKDSKMAGIDWVQGFMARHDLSLRQPQGTSINRASGFNKGEVSKFFSLYKGLLEDHEFPPSRIWNVDETGLTTVQNPQKVVTSKGIRSVGKITSGERGTLVTMLCDCNAAGAFLPPMYIFPRQRMSDSLMAGAPPQSIGFASKNGWIDQDLFVKWLEHFMKFADPSHENPHIIILDGHHSHKTLAAVDFCRENGIHLLTLPPHSTHKMQPLDRTYFKSLKSAFNQTADTYMVANPGRRFTIHDIAKLSGSAFQRTALPDKGMNGFKVCGIHPYNPNVFDDGDFAAVLSYQEQMPRQDEHSSSAKNSPVLSDTNEKNETARNDLIETSSPEIQDKADRPSGTVNERSGEILSTSDDDGASEHREIGNTIPSVSNQYNTVRVKGDGRCLFRSLIAGMHLNLRTVERDDNGKPIDPMLDVYEQSQSDELRAKLVSYMCTNISNYSDIEGDAVNADMPPGIRFTSVQERIAAMSDPKCMPGEIEINAISAILERPIFVMSKNNSVISIYGVSSFDYAEALFVQFESVGQDVGHYDCLVKVNAQEEVTAPENPPELYKIIHKLSPLPKPSTGKKSNRKRESAAVLTSSPYKNDLLKKSAKKTKTKRCTSKDSDKKKSNSIQAQENGDENENKDWSCLNAERRIVFLDLGTFGYNVRCVKCGLMNYALTDCLSLSALLVTKMTVRNASVCLLCCD